MRTVHRLRFHPDARAPGGSTLIDRYLGRDDHARRGGWETAPPSTGLGSIEISLVDTSGAAVQLARTGGATGWHVIWVRSATAATVSIDAGRDAATWPVTPGDTVIAPPTAALRAEGGQLAVAIDVPGASATIPLAPPTHGSERFFGYNRQTICCRVGDVRLCRWKLTQPLDLADHHPAPALVLALARDSVIRASSTIDTLVQGELALIDPAARPVVMPDGLSYLLTIDREP